MVLGTLHFVMCRNVKCTETLCGFGCFGVLCFGFVYRFWTEGAPMVAGLLHLPTATWGGRMGLYLLSTLVLSGSTPFGDILEDCWRDAFIHAIMPVNSERTVV